MKPAAKNELLVTRTFAAPLETIWKAWTDPKEIQKWWGPRDFTVPQITSDFRVAGKYLFCMRGAGPDGTVKDFWSAGKYLDILPMQKIVMSMTFSDQHGHPVPPARYGLPGKWRDELRLTVIFDEAMGGRTRLTVRQAGIADEMLEASNLGWNQSLDKFAAVLATKALSAEKDKLAA